MPCLASDIAGPGCIVGTETRDESERKPSNALLNRHVRVLVRDSDPADEAEDEGGLDEVIGPLSPNEGLPRFSSAKTCA